MDQKLILISIILLSIIQSAQLMNKYNLVNQCGKRISMISADIKGAILYYEGQFFDRTPCTVEIWGWFENDLAMHFRHFNTVTTQTYVEIRQGDSWDESRPIREMPERLSGTTFNQLNHVFTSDWMDVFIRIGGRAPPDGVRIFELAMNVFHTGRCNSWESSCKNGWCIDKDLRCNGYNPCGDNSDCDKDSMSSGKIAVISVSVITGTFAVASFFYYCCRARWRKRSQARQDLRHCGPPRYDREEHSHQSREQSQQNREPDIASRSRAYNPRSNRGEESANQPHNFINTSHSRNVIDSNHSGSTQENGVDECSAPPNYNTVVSSGDTEQFTDLRDITNRPDPPDYNTAVSTNNSPNLSNTRQTGANDQTQDRNSSADLPTYNDVLRNEEAYRIVLEGDNSIVYQV